MFKKLILILFFVLSSIFLRLSYSQESPIVKIGIDRIEKEALFLNVGRMSTDYLEIKVEGKGYVKIIVVNNTAFIETQNGILGVTLPLRIYPDGYYINYKSNYYRGYLEISTNRWIINVLNIEDYLLSVVPSEMPSYFPMEALKAQAVASRTYALRNRRRHGDFDLCNTTHCQVYKGVKIENDRTSKAVLETIGEVITYNNQLIKAFFHSSSGGYTEDCKYVWGEDLPYLKSVKDVEELTSDSWIRYLSLSDLLAKLTNLGININNNFSLELEKTSSGRVYRLWLRDAQNIYTLRGTTFRSLFELPSTLFELELNDDKILIRGKGHGHGVGLSQKGARFLAEKGYNYKEILKYYYQGVEIVKWY